MIRPSYHLTGYLITPLLKLWLKRRAKRGKEDTARMKERFGHASIPRPEGTLIWLHAASVGEAQSVLTLVRALTTHYPGLHLLITTGTVTSAALIAQQQLPRVIHQFFPVDTAPAVRRFLDHWHPDLVLWVESELWPQLLWQVQARGIPMLLINARISVQSMRGWEKWPRTIRSLLNSFTAIYAGSTEDAKRLVHLGAGNVHDVGNLKYDAGILPIDNALLNELAQSSAGRPIWVAASTHANEEIMVAHAHAIAAQQFPDLLCILIPRHANRGDAIAADLRHAGYILAQRSKHEPITPKTSFYLADTMGELGSFYRLADLVFLGGSLVAVGGHNPLEPARLSCALMTGPHTHNFATIMQHLEANHGLRMVHDKDALATTLIALLHDDAGRLAMAEKAMQVVQEARGASDHIVQHCIALLEERAS